MSWVTLSLRKITLRKRISDMEAQQIAISQKVQDLHKYSNAVGKGYLTTTDLASAPSSLFGNYLQYAQTSSAVAYQSAYLKTTEQLNTSQQIDMGTGGQYYLVSDPTGQQRLMQDYEIFNQRYKEELEECAKQAAEQIKVQEDALEAERLKLDTQIKAANAEYEAIVKQEDSNIKRDVIQLA